MIKIINGSKEYWPIIRTIAENTWPDTFGNILSAEQMAYMIEWMYSPEAIREQVEELNHHYILAGSNDEHLGYASFEHNYQLQNITKLHKIYILPQAQGKGVGKALLNEVTLRAKAQGNEYIQLNVNRSNKAVKFYESKGFFIVGEEDNPIGNGYFMNDYVMNMALK